MIEGLVNQLVYFAFFQCMLLIGVFTLSKKNRKSINPYLAIFIGVLMVGLLGRVFYISGLMGEDKRWVVFSEMGTLFFGSTIYLFTRSALFQRGFNKSDLVHYVLPVIYNIGVIVTFIILHENEKPFWITLLFIGTGLFINVMYWLLSCSLFRSFEASLQSELSHSIQTHFFRNFLTCIGICLGLWILLFVGGVIDARFIPRAVWQMVWMTIAILILFLTYYAIQDPEIFRVKISLKSKTKYASSKFTNADLDIMKEKLEVLMIEQKPFLNRKLLKSELSEMLGVSNPEMARLLNERIGMSFFEYVNYYRIKEFIELAKTHKSKELTLFGLAQEAGFHSKTTFNKSFKQIMGTTPTRYFEAENN